MCIKCIIDSGHNAAVANWLREEQVVFTRTIEELFAAEPLTGKPKHALTTEEHEEIIRISQEWCDSADRIESEIENWGYRLRKIAVAHSFPLTPPRPAV